MLTFIDRPLAWLRRYFREPILPRAGLAVSRGRLLGVSLAAKEARVASHVALALPEGVVEPSFDRPNILRPGVLEDKVKDAARRLGLGSADILLLPPETCFKAYVLAFDEFPAAEAERLVLLNHRLDKLLPLRPGDARLAYDVLPGEGKAKVFLTLARSEVIGEYERVFERAGLRPRSVSLPSLGLLGCTPGEPGRTALVADIEEESIGLLALAGAEIVLYRFKPFLGEPGGAVSAETRLEQAATEIENTLHFLEDREGRRDETVHVRCLISPTSGEALEFLRRRLSAQVVPVACPLALAASGTDKIVFAPLLGHLS
ncbi:MAG: hypothetical protein NTZ26_00690 [Candidatus Aminicenantes bacterium]|nr:hypothetical protein [Candidatus Aminicenantes bacterium]